jgi:hypothetical protein
VTVREDIDGNQPRGFRFVLESYGVPVEIQASSRQLLKKAELAARKALLDRLKLVENVNAEHNFGIFAGEGDRLYLLRNGEKVSEDDSEGRFFKFFDSLLRITVAEHAEDRVFVHAGVVGRNGKAIVIPGHSFGGKTTLVAELVRNGAVYYSDEYAILDSAGLVHPFPRALSVRYHDGEFREEQVFAESLGASIGSDPIPIGLVLLTEYVEGALWKPGQLTVGQGMMEVLPHTIPRLFNPKFSLKVLNTAVSDAIILKSSRGDATNFANELLSFFDNYIYLAKTT